MIEKSRNIAIRSSKRISRTERASIELEVSLLGQVFFGNLVLHFSPDFGSNAP